MAYVDGFVIPIPKKNLDEYKKMAKIGGKMWMKHGALEYFECVGDDLNPKMEGMKMTGFPKMTNIKSNETVIYSFIIYNSKVHRDKVNAKVMKEIEKEMAKWKDKPMPFDVKRMAYGGFKSIVELKK
ncbi:DUF1428 domain-containing protein [Candidatus Woesearchaeota archaeon]|nr:DUF1428 domain-containing protein [Candidatus Woesearchaeota archaeon]